MLKTALSEVNENILNKENQMSAKENKLTKKSSKNDATSSELTQRINSLYELMHLENLDELEIKETDFYLYIKRKTSAQSNNTNDLSQQNNTPIQIINTKQTSNDEDKLTVKSPIIGIFYRAPSPSSPPFVKEGDTVALGTTLCIVEAMKVMNEIKADYRLKIVKILVENGKNVTSGQDIFVIEKA